MSWPWITVLAALAAVTLAQTLVIIGLVTRTSTVLARLEAFLHAAQPDIGPPVGTPLPDVTLLDADQQPVPTAELRGRPFVMLALSPACGPCDRLLERLGHAPQPDRSVRILAISDARDAAALASRPLPAWITILHERGGEAARALHLDRTPLAVAFGSSGTVVGSTIPADADDLQRLAHLAQTNDSRQETRRPS